MITGSVVSMSKFHWSFQPFLDFPQYLSVVVMTKFRWTFQHYQACPNHGIFIKKMLSFCSGWAFADSVLHRLAPLWVGARGLEFTWDYVLQGLEANANLVHTNFLFLERSICNCFSLPSNVCVKFRCSRYLQLHQVL